jgi:preprotein translocase subunit YajC
MNQFILFLQAAAPAAPQSGMGTSGTLIFMGIAVAVMYFFMIRPQGQVRKKQGDFMASLKRGKRVVTIGGIHGTIMEIDETQIQLLVAPKVVITMRRDAISMDFTNALTTTDATTTAATPAAALSGTAEASTLEK